MAMTKKRAAEVGPETQFKVTQAGVLVRMYRQGLGDCFLIGFPGRGRDPIYMLIDCGVLMATPNGAVKMREVAGDICQAVGGRLHVLVATHGHWDHLSGFAQAEDLFERCQIDEAWLPWTEDPQDAAARLLNKRSLGPGARLGGTAKALQWIRRRAGHVRYLRPGELLFPLPGAEDVRIYVLGPPGTPAPSGGFRAAARGGKASTPSAGRGDGSGAAGPVASESPFDAASRVLPDEARRIPFFAQHYFSNRDEEWRRIDPASAPPPRRFTLLREMDVNNRSLVLAIELVESGRVLLFPGDAQELSWRSWHDLSWTVGRPGGARTTVTAADLLARTVLYKVSHHGSAPGNPAAGGLELMVSPELTALLPVDEAVARNQRWLMPHEAVLQRLTELTQGRVIRSDTGIPAGVAGGEVVRFSRSAGASPLFMDVGVSRRVARDQTDTARRLEEVLRGPVLDNFEGYAAAALTGEAGAPVRAVAPGGRCRLSVLMRPDEPAGGAAEPIRIEDGQDAPEVTFKVVADGGPLGIAPRRGTITVSEDGTSAGAAFEVTVPEATEAGSYPVYVQVYQKTQLLCVLRLKLKVARPSRARAAR